MTKPTLFQKLFISPDLRTRHKGQSLPHPPHTTLGLSFEAFFKPCLIPRPTQNTARVQNTTSAQVCFPLFLSGLSQMYRALLAQRRLIKDLTVLPPRVVFGHPENKDKFSALDIEVLVAWSLSPFPRHLRVPAMAPDLGRSGGGGVVNVDSSCTVLSFCTGPQSFKLNHPSFTMYLHSVGAVALVPPPPLPHPPSFKTELSWNLCRPAWP